VTRRAGRPAARRPRPASAGDGLGRCGVLGPSARPAGCPALAQGLPAAAQAGFCARQPVLRAHIV
jgi:hypothetical protein